MEGRGGWVRLGPGTELCLMEGSRGPFSVTACAAPAPGHVLFPRRLPIFGKGTSYYSACGCAWIPIWNFGTDLLGEYACCEKRWD